MFILGLILLTSNSLATEGLNVRPITNSMSLNLLLIDYGCGTLFYNFILCQGENCNVCVCDIDDQNTMYAFSKGPLVVYLNQFSNNTKVGQLI